MEKIELGREVRCLVTGFTGIATSRTEYLKGCVKVCVQPKVDKEGKHPDGFFLDEPQLEYTKNKKNVFGKKIEEVKADGRWKGGPPIRATNSNGLSSLRFQR